MSGRFKVRAEGGGYVFQFEDGSRRVVFNSRRYQSKHGAAGGVESMRQSAVFDERYERLIAASGHTYFNLKTAAGEIIGTSVMFATPQARLDAIAYIQQEAPEAPVLTVD